MFNLKNLRLYRLSRDVKFNRATFQSQLSAMAFAPCGSQDTAKTGWVPPLGDTAEQLFHVCNGGHILLMYRREEKILPGEVLRKELAAKIAKLEGLQGRKLKKTEKDSLKDEVLHSLLPRAFTRMADTWLWIDTARSLIAVDTGSAKKAEDVLALLRKTLGSLPVVPLTMDTPIELTLTEWVKQGRAPQAFDLGDAAVLQAVLADGGKLTCKKQELNSEEIATHLAAGKVVTRLNLGWMDGRIDFTLTDDFGLNGIKFSDVLLDQNNDAEDARARFDADVMLLTGELAKLIADLVKELGGESKKIIPEEEYTDSYTDPLLDDAIRFVLDTARPTISAIQRHFRIGYNRAARIIEAMEAKGVLSAPRHDGTRTIVAGAEAAR
ncbi:TPA: recombination-associated protein RdgC [Kluyvera ascorbata]|nr:recombination-associated protein RdgC [Kluyvera ascorbata]